MIVTADIDQFYMVTAVYELNDFPGRFYNINIKHTKCIPREIYNMIQLTNLEIGGCTFEDSEEKICCLCKNLKVSHKINNLTILDYLLWYNISDIQAIKNNISLKALYVGNIEGNITDIVNVLDNLKELNEVIVLNTNTYRNLRKRMVKKKILH